MAGTTHESTANLIRAYVTSRGVQDCDFLHPLAQYSLSCAPCNIIWLRSYRAKLNAIYYLLNQNADDLLSILERIFFTISTHLVNYCSYKIIYRFIAKQKTCLPTMIGCIRITKCYVKKTDA